MIRFIRHYLVGLVAAMWNGGISGVAGILGINGASLTGIAPEARVLNFSEMASAFTGAVVIHGIFWLKSHPLPESLDTGHPFWKDVRDTSIAPKTVS
jgi:hypothetical protein